MEFDSSVQGASWRWPLLLSVVVLNVRILYDFRVNTNNNSNNNNGNTSLNS